MQETSIVGIAIFAVVFLASYTGFKDRLFFEKYLFQVDAILIAKQYYRLLSSGFLHKSWSHLIFNMITLLSFSEAVELVFGYQNFLIIYFASLIGGGLFALFIHRNHGDYSSVGASGAISGVIFSFIVVFPDSDLSMIFIPITFKAWVFGLIYIIISILGTKNQKGDIGHEAHLGGAVIGVLLTMALKPEIIVPNAWIIAAVLIPFILFLIIIIKYPIFMLAPDYWGTPAQQTKVNKTIIQKRKQLQQSYNREEDMNALLDKIQEKGIGSLTQKERQRLDELTKLS
jgi:membrane associated rhomboid family serine protease